MSDLVDPALIAFLGTKEPWQSDALCVEYFPRVDWFRKRGDDTEPAKVICTRCLVREECLEYALRNEIEEGVWGGLSSKQRRAQLTIKRAADRAASKPRRGDAIDSINESMGGAPPAESSPADAPAGPARQSPTITAVDPWDGYRFNRRT